MMEYYGMEMKLEIFIADIYGQDEIYSIFSKLRSKLSDIEEINEIVI